MDRVTACLLSWKRPRNVERIVGAIDRLEFVDEILVWNNAPRTRLSLSSRKARVINSDANACCSGRYLCAARARNNIVYVQDDDVLVHDIPGLYRTFLSDPGRVTHTLSSWHFARRGRHVYGQCESALLGWGAFLQRDWLRVLEAVPSSLRATALFRREADQFFTILLRRHHVAVAGRITHLATHSTPGVALWVDPAAAEMSALAVREALGIARRTMAFCVPVRWHVVITCHDYGRYLAEAVESVCSNDADYELTVVDDASADETRAVIAALTERYPHLRSLQLANRRGTGGARNAGIASCDSVFVATLDADDRFGPDYLFEAGRVLERGADVANPDAILFGASSDRWPVPQAISLAAELRHNRVHYCAGYRRSYWAQLCGYDESPDLLEDYDFWIRAIAAGARVEPIAGDHFFYRRHDQSRSTESFAEDRLANTLKKHQALASPV
ncbi:MAG TPA: glycosyltransferase family 2 protein [Gemmatimonadaceae bacterium]|nr:glycosyltransferase family 2 protein [Gemmatimonadaceae bacterium]